MDLQSIASNIKTQDNRFTQDPMFVVWQENHVYGFDPQWSEEHVWIDPEGDEASAEEANRLDNIDELWGDFGDWTKTEKQVFKKFVTACFTEDQATSYIESNRHRMKNPSFSVESWNRNPEMILVRDHLLALSPNQ